MNGRIVIIVVVRPSSTHHIVIIIVSRKVVMIIIFTIEVAKGVVDGSGHVLGSHHTRSENLM